MTKVKEKASPKKCQHEGIKKNLEKTPNTKLAVCPDCHVEAGGWMSSAESPAKTATASTKPSSTGSKPSASATATTESSEEPPLPPLPPELAEAGFAESAERHRSLGDQINDLEKQRKKLGEELKEFLEEMKLPGCHWVSRGGFKHEAYLQGRVTTKLEPELLLKAGVPAETIKACTVKKPATYHVEVKRTAEKKE